MVKEYSDAQTAYFNAMQKAKTDEERQKAADLSPKPEKLAPRFLELAEKNPKEPVAIDALAWIVTNTGSAAKAEKDKAFDLLFRNHIDSDRLGTVCQFLAFGYEKRDETFLRAVMEKNPSRGVKGDACLSLGQLLHQRAGLVQRLADDPKIADQIEKVLGKDVAAELKSA